MRLSLFYVVGATLAQQFVVADSIQSPAAPTPFSSHFHQPSPPVIKPEFKANWNQHKWNENISHIASGYIYNSPSNKKVRVDETYDLGLGSSLFNYANTSNGLIQNIQWILSPAVASTPTIFNDYISLPAFPILPADLLVTSNAVYAGVVQDPYAGSVIAWNLLYASQLPVTVLLDSSGIVQGYDYWDPNQRTYAMTRFFNIVIGKLPADLFAFPALGHT